MHIDNVPAVSGEAVSMTFAPAHPGAGICSLRSSRTAAGPVRTSQGITDLLLGAMWCAGATLPIADGLLDGRSSTASQLPPRHNRTESGNRLHSVTARKDGHLSHAHCVSCVTGPTSPENGDTDRREGKQRTVPAAVGTEPTSVVLASLARPSTAFLRSAQPRDCFVSMSACCSLFLLPHIQRH
jgi:hypothetical protein